MMDKNYLLITKVKRSFLYTQKEKYFDFSSSYSSHLFGYQNSFIKSKIKQSIHLSFPYRFYFFNKATSLLKGLFIRHPFLKNYHLSMFSKVKLQNLILKNSFNFYKESIDLDEDFLFKQNKSSSHHYEKNNLYTDSYFFFNRPLLKGIKGIQVLWINAFFPFIFNCLEKADFDFIVVGGKHPFGFNQEKLVFSKKKLNVDEQIYKWSLFVYQEGLGYFYRKIKQKQYETLTNFLIFQIETLQKKKLIKSYVGEGLYYRLKLGKDVLKTKQVTSNLKNRFYFKTISFLAKDSFLYIALSFNAEIQHLKNCFKQLESFIKDA